LILIVGTASTGRASNIITNVVMNPGSPAALRSNTHVDIAFDYVTDAPGGARIFFRPFSGGNLSPSYAAHGSPLYPAGGGSDTAFFTITDGEVLVDQVRVQILNADQTVLLHEEFFGVRYHFAASGEVTNIHLAPEPPATLEFGVHVDITFDCFVDDPGGVRVFFLPYTGGSPTPNYAVSPSPLYPGGSGSGTGYITISSGEVTVDELRVRMTSADQSTTHHEFRFPVEYLFRHQSAVEPATWGRVKRLFGGAE
jgi:hypothetical protein